MSISLRYDPITKNPNHTLSLEASSTLLLASPRSPPNRRLFADGCIPVNHFFSSPLLVHTLIRWSGVSMFQLSILEHTLRLKPDLLSLPINEAVKGELEALFLDKVITDLGLCISVYDIQSINGGFIFANEGAPTYTVKFRLIIFRPFIGEIISARLKESNADGLRLTLGFFDDIYIPDLLLPNSSRAEPDTEHKNQVKWIWTFKEEEQVREYLIDGYDEIRFRVQSIKFPEIPKEQKDSKPFAPMEIIGSLVSDAGLGPISWWVSM
ncbi:hypothetical protein L2E82_20074 [Cichorium intybus]|uniref:Uncharacterized protein n=1 Tax=Cichorium intybus TaxID=13427 RepID=A0ACB9DSC3_CICIN|nr:hypothetical protein L2E82_20074 [Cichorium intybus]